MMMEDSKRCPPIAYDNRGSSLLIVLAIFVVLLVVAMNLVMLVAAGDNTANEEYQEQQTELYIASIYQILNEKVLDGTWNDAFVSGETVTINVTGFQDGNGSAIPIVIEVERDRKKANVSYYITLDGQQYLITAQYRYTYANGTVTITLKNCQEMIRL